MAKNVKRGGDVDFTKMAKDIVRKRGEHNSALVKRKLENPTDPHQLRVDQFEKYYNNVEDYAMDFFGVTFWAKQLEIIHALRDHNFVCVRSAQSTGKSYLLGILINFYFDTMYPLVGIGTAPTEPLMMGVMFAYARQFRSLAQDTLEYPRSFWTGPAYPKLMTQEGHYFEGIVTKDPTAMQGRHGPNVVILVDEAMGIRPAMFEALETIMTADNVRVLVIYNPTDPSSYVAQVLEKQSNWVTISMSAYDHPNIWAGVENIANGTPPNSNLPFPGAMNLTRFETLLKQWSHRINGTEFDPARDIVLPSSTLQHELEYYRPGPIASSRLLGRWAETAENNVYTEFIIDGSRMNIIKSAPDDVLTIGVDVARYGSDFSSFCVRFGYKVLELFEINGLSTVEVTSRTIALCKKYGESFEVPAQSIAIAVDAIGIGAGVHDNLIEAGYNSHEINVSERAWDREQYVNLRTELWFGALELFREGKISLGSIPQHTFRELKKQLIAPYFHYDKSGRQQLESKDDTKKRIDRSPDLADALMLSFAVNTEFTTGITGVRSE